MTRVIVAAAVIERGGRFLVTRRQAGVHLAGYWEFPGGKCDDGESIDACLVREIREELDAGVVVGSEVLVTRHDYGDRGVELHFLKSELTGEPRPLMGQEMRWVAREELTGLQFPPADAEMVRILSVRT